MSEPSDTWDWRWPDLADAERRLIEASTTALPDWAESWSKAKCECGARCVRVACYCGGHTVCSDSGWDADVCLSHNAPADEPVNPHYFDGLQP